MIYGGTKKVYKKIFYMGNKILENTNEYKYLDIWFDF